MSARQAQAAASSGRGRARERTPKSGPHSTTPETRPSVPPAASTEKQRLSSELREEIAYCDKRVAVYVLDSIGIDEGLGDLTLCGLEELCADFAMFCETRLERLDNADADTANFLHRFESRIHALVLLERREIKRRQLRLVTPQVEADATTANKAAEGGDQALRAIAKDPRTRELHQ